MHRCSKAQLLWPRHLQQQMLALRTIVGSIVQHLLPSATSGPAEHCGQLEEIIPSRNSCYVLNENRPAHEIIIKDGPTCLTRENLLSLGLKREMDSVVGNACLRLVKETAELQGKNVYYGPPHPPNMAPTLQL